MEDTQNQNVAKKGSNNALLIVLGLIAVALIAAAGYYFTKDKSGTDADQQQNTQDEVVVAKVNGVELYQDDYQRNIDQMASAYAAQGLDTNEAETAALISEQALNALVNRQVVLQAAAAANVSVSDEEIETEYQNVMTSLGGAEAMTTALEQAGLNETSLRENLENELRIQKYLEGEANLSALTVTDAEVTAYYETAKAENAEVPALEEVSELIKQQLLIEKQQAAINTVLERLRAEAEIEVLI